ncbi:hypothetical protein BX600DRAFT_469997 [Xylariales sp. PMI_506]|nr:hypothetical protein BX600DRAFT_469997 [Xylariales sp. PMI_506]
MANEIQNMMGLARWHMEKRHILNARNAMAKAQSLWAATEELQTDPEPEFTPQELHELNIAELQETVALARWHMERRHILSARDAMAKAQSLWAATEELQTDPEPEFTPQELLELDIAEMQDITALVLHNATSGWIEGTQAAFGRAQEIWMRIGGPRPLLPEIHVEVQPSQTSATTLVEASFQCPICYNSFESGCQTSCTHTFCMQCINSWMDISRSCPLCRSIL